MKIQKKSKLKNKYSRATECFYLPNTIKINTFAPTKPHAKQLEVLSSPERFKLLRAGRKFRKTSLGISWLFEQALLNPSLNYPYIAPNRTQAKNIAWDDHVQRLLDEFVKKGVPFKKNETELSITFPHGGCVRLFGVENQEALRGISNWGGLVADEYDDWKQDIWATIIRPNLMVHKAPAIVMGTPKGKSNMWRLSQSSEFKEFHYTSHDNPDLSRDELEQMVKEYKELGEDYYKQEILAEYVKPVGLVYREWDDSRQYLNIPYEPNLPLHISFDWGINDPTAVIWFQTNKSELRVIDYYEMSNANIEHFISVIQSKPYKPAELYTGDPAGKARSLVTGTSVIEIMAQKGVYVRTKDGVKIPNQIRVAHSRIPSLFVSTKAERFRDCLLNYKYPEISDTIRNQENEIPIHDEWSHAMRAFEYYCVNTQDFSTPQMYRDNPKFGTGDYIFKSIQDLHESQSEDDYL